METPAILPRPVSLQMNSGTLDLGKTVPVVAIDSGANKIASFLIDYLETNQKHGLLSAEDQESSITLALSEEPSPGEEGYTLVIDAKGIHLGASTDAGLFYGVQTLIQILNQDPDKVPFLSITDQPRFHYRGMHLDVGRHMFPVNFIKKYIDMMAHFKYNTFHWHLTEDQGWRIEIKKYPALQEVAAFRDSTVVGHASSKTRDQAKYDGERYGGFYTQEEVKEVVSYARDRFITVIPEIELPGHAQATLTAYPYLGCTGGPYHTATSWGVFDNIYCAGKETTFEFLENVFDEVLPLFPGKYVHIGGDEAPKTKWEECPYCQKRIKDEGLKDEHELQSYFVQRIEKYLNAKGKTMIGWDEILEGGLAQNAVVMSWRGEDGGIEAARQGHDVIMTPTDWCYFDYYQAGPEGEPLAIGNMTTVREVYGYEPVPEELSDQEASHILGAQCNLWTEYIPDGKQAEYMVYPRAIALAQVLWSPENAKDYDRFTGDLDHLRPLLDQWNIHYATHVFTNGSE